MPILEGPLQAAIGDSVIKGFVEAHSPADVLRELAQDEYDARGTRIAVDFFEQHLRIVGNGDGIDSAGWDRLSLLLGTGRAIGSPDPSRVVKPKVNGIGSKNFGLRSLFLFGDRIYVSSRGRQLLLDLRNLGTRSGSDPSSRKRRGVLIIVPYRCEPLDDLPTFDLSRQVEALDDLISNLQGTLIKLAVPGSEKRLSELVVSSANQGI